MSFANVVYFCMMNWYGVEIRQPTLQLSQQGPVEHSAWSRSLQVMWSQHGSRRAHSAPSTVPQSQSSPSSTIPLPQLRIFSCGQRVTVKTGTLGSVHSSTVTIIAVFHDTVSRYRSYGSSAVGGDDGQSAQLSSRIFTDTGTDTDTEYKWNATVGVWRGIKCGRQHSTIKCIMVTDLSTVNVAGQRSKHG